MVGRSTVVVHAHEMLDREQVAVGQRDVASVEGVGVFGESKIGSAVVLRDPLEKWFERGDLPDLSLEFGLEWLHRNPLFIQYVLQIYSTLKLRTHSCQFSQLLVMKSTLC